MEEIYVNFRQKKLLLHNRGQKKICTIERKIVRNNGPLKLKYNNREVAKDKDTHGISFVNCKLHAWPLYEAIHNYFPNLVSIQIKHCSLQVITKESLRDYFALRELFFNENMIQALPGDLFEYTPQIEVVSFKNNRIKFIDAGIFDGIHNLKYFDLSGNKNIDCVYDATKAQGKSLHDVEMEIRMRCKLTVSDIQQLLCESKQQNSQRPHNPELMKKCDFLQKQVDAKQKFIEGNQKLIAELKASVRHWMSLSKDFTITIEGKDIKVHKSVINEASPLLKELTDSDPEADSLELKDISVETFKEILDFMYEKKLPHQSANLVEIYSAASRLEMNQLAQFASKRVAKIINQDNAYEILKLSNKYDDDTLRSAAFKEFKKIFPNQNFSHEIATQPEALAKIMAMKKAMDEAFASLQL